MRGLILFLYRNQTLFLFALLEFACLWLIVRDGGYSSWAFLSSSNEVAGYVAERSNTIRRYALLDERNETLTQANEAQRKRIERLELRINDLQGRLRVENLDSALREGEGYEFISALAVNSSFLRPDNFMTLDKGRNSGIRPGMGVISEKGVAGIVKACSPSYATAYSLLHSSVRVSSRLKKDGRLCVTQWDGADYRLADLLYVSRHADVQPGDTVLTSGNNAVFPAGVMVGTVAEVRPDPSSDFHLIRLELSVDFSRVDYVYAVKPRFKQEKDSVEQAAGVQ